MHLQLASGDRIGDWVVVEALGSGGMGSVYRCHNALTKQVKAAVKVLALSNQSGAKERFVRELEVLASLDHPNIVRVLGGGEDSNRGTLYLAMELVEGKDLTWYIDHRPLPWAEACRITRDVARALATAHEAGVHHRDLKPANIMLGDDGKVKLIDFGIALADGQTRLTRARGIPGTMSYMPPEVFTQGSHDPALGDLYSLGVCLYEALVGKRAYPEDLALTTVQRFAAVMGQKSRDEWLDPGEEIPAGVRELVKALTHRDPTRRIGDATSLADALEEMIDGEETGKAHTPAPSPRRPKSTEDTFTLDAEERRPSGPPPPPPKVKKKARVRHARPYAETVPQTRAIQPFFPVLSLLLSMFLAVAPPMWTFFWFFVAVVLPELGVLVLALSLMAAPIGLPVVSLLGLVFTAWFAVRVRRTSSIPLFWWFVACCLLVVHLWHLFLAVADAAWMVSLAQAAMEDPQPTWRDFINY